MIDHEETKRDLVELVFGELDERRETLLQQHLAGCAECREEEARLLRLREDLRGGGADLSRETRERIRAALPRRRRRGLLGALRRPVPAYAAAAACVAVFLLARGIADEPRSAVRVRPAVTIEETSASFSVAGSYETAVTWQNPAIDPEGLGSDSL
jgi:anti-sigma factor RsiW